MQQVVAGYRTPPDEKTRVVGGTGAWRCGGGRGGDKRAGGSSVRGVEASLKFPLFLRGLPSHCWCLPATRCLVTPPSHHRTWSVERRSFTTPLTRRRATCRSRRSGCTRYSYACVSVLLHVWGSVGRDRICGGFWGERAGKGMSRHRAQRCLHFLRGQQPRPSTSFSCASTPALPVPSFPCCPPLHSRLWCRLQHSQD